MRTTLRGTLLGVILAAGCVSPDLHLSGEVRRAAPGTPAGIYRRGDPTLGRGDQPKLEGAMVLFSPRTRTGAFSEGGAAMAVDVEEWRFDGGCSRVTDGRRTWPFRDVTVECAAPGFEKIERTFDVRPDGDELELVIVLAPGR